MVGYYKLEQKLVDQLNMNCKNIEENIYHICCPLIVKNKKDLDKDILYLYEMLEIPIVPFHEIKKFDFGQSKKRDSYLEQFSKYLELNIDIELEEENELGHLLRVGRYAKELASSLNLEKEKIRDIYIAALFHDIGKYLIPKEIIGKNGKLTDEEFETIKKHCVLARPVLNQFLNENILNMIESHHERFNGTGYPKGSIPNLGAQIIGIADSYDAMLSSRVYQSAKTKKEAFKELLLCTKKKESGGKGMLYDLELVEKFIANEQ